MKSRGHARAVTRAEGETVTLRARGATLSPAHFFITNTVICSFSDHQETNYKTYLISFIDSRFLTVLTLCFKSFLKGLLAGRKPVCQLELGS